MPFDLSSLSIPSLDAALGALTETYNPSTAVSSVAGNITAQQSAVEATRTALAAVRAAAQKETANADFAALSAYTTSLQAQSDTACVISSTKPALTAMTADTLSNPLSSVSLGLDSGITELEFSDALLGSGAAGLGSVLGADTAGITNMLEDPLSTDNLTDLAIMGTGMYVSSLTGGVVSPAICSSVIDSVADDAINSAIATVSTDATTIIQASSATNPNVAAASITSVINADTTGTLLEATVAKATQNAYTHMSSTEFASLTGADIRDISDTLCANLGYSASEYINATSIGGVGLTDTSAIENALLLSGLSHAVSIGDVSQVNMYTTSLANNGVPASVYQDTVDSIATTMLQTIGGVSEYASMYSADTTTDIATIDTSQIYSAYTLQDSNNILTRARLVSFWAAHTTAPIVIGESGIVNIVHTPTTKTTTLSVTAINGEPLALTRIAVAETSSTWTTANLFFYVNDSPTTILVYNKARNTWRYVNLTSTIPGDYVYKLAYDLVELDASDGTATASMDLTTNVVAKVGGTLASTILGTDTANKIIAQQTFLASNYA